MPITETQSKWLLWSAILVVALGVRLGAAAWWQQRLGAPEAFAFGDSDSYWHLAGRIAEGKPYQYGGPEAKLMRMPGYPALLSLAFLTWGGEPPVVFGRAVGALAGVAAVAACICLAQQQFGGLAGAFAGLLSAVYPGGVATSVFVLSEALFCPLLIVQAACWIRALQAGSGSRRASLGWSLAAGVSSAAAVYARPSWLLFPIFLLLCGLMFDLGRRLVHLKVAVIVAVVLIACLMPWWVRGYQVTGHFVLTTLEMGASLYDGLNPEADGGSNMDFKRSFYLAEERENPTAGPGEFAYRVDQRMRTAAWRWAVSHPARTLQLAGVKMIRLWSPWPNAGQFRSLTMRCLVALGFLPLLATSLIAAWRFRGTHWEVIVVVAAPALYLSALHLVFVSSIRYRQPAMLLATVLAGALLSELWMRYRKPSRLVQEGSPASA